MRTGSAAARPARPRPPVLRILPAALAAAVLTALSAATVALGVHRQAEPFPYLGYVAAAWLVFGAGIVLLRLVPGRAVPALVLVGTAAIGVAALTGPPTTSTDSARYNWDGIVQSAGIDPYRYVPADAALEELRPAWLFPAGTTDAAGRLVCPGPLARPTAERGGSGEICTVINRPQVPTIYPPAAEALFTIVRAPLPRDAQYWPTQVLGLAVVLGTTALLLAALRRRGLDPRWAALWGWCPLVASDAVTNAHIDGAGAFFALAATLLVASGRPLRGGVVLGIAIATKFVPVLAAPPLLRRSPVRIIGAAVLTVALGYLPHVLASGAGVVGYLPGYLAEEGYGDGSRSALVSLLVPSGAATLVAAALVAVIAVVALVRADPASPWVWQCVVIGSALLLLSPRYAWYALLLVPFVAMSGRWEWFGVPLALTLRQYAPDAVTFRAALLAAIVAVLVGALFRRNIKRTRIGGARRGFLAIR